MSAHGRRARHHPVLDDDDPLSGMVNLFDLAIVFAVGLIIALAAAMKTGRLATGQPAQAAQAAQASGPTEIEVKEGQKLVKYRSSDDKTRGPGHRIGTAFRLPSGEVVYVPDEEGQAAASP